MPLNDFAHDPVFLRGQMKVMESFQCKTIKAKGESFS